MNKQALRSILRDAKKKIKTNSELIDDLKEEAAHGQSWEDRQEAKENVAHINGQSISLKNAVNAIKSGVSPEEFLRMTEESIRLMIDEMKFLADYTGRSMGWRSYITSGVISKFDEDTYVGLAELVGSISELIQLDKEYALGLDQNLVRSAKEYATLRHRPGEGAGPRDWWPSEI